MIQIEFTPTEQQALHYERYHHPQPLVQRRMEALWLKSHHLPHTLIATLTGVCENTLRSYFQTYVDGGLEKLKETHFYHPESELQPHAPCLETYFRAHLPATVKEAQSEIEQLTGVRRSETQVRQFLSKLGMRCRKVGMVPAKANPAEQATYVQTQLEPRLADARAGTRVVFFVDAAHFVLAPFLGFLWSFARVFIRAPAGRQRFNVLGALNGLKTTLRSRMS